MTTPGALEAGSVSDACREKYDRYGSEMVGSVVSPEAERSTLRLLPSNRREINRPRSPIATGSGGIEPP
jgi:hypothetical protein